MTKEQFALAEAMYWDTLSRGGLRWKPIACIGILLGFAACITVLCLRVSSIAHAIAFVLVLITGLLLIPVMLCLWRILRVMRNTSLISDCASALAELEAQSAPADRKSRIYGKNFAFFFERGVVLEYREVDHFYAEWYYRIGTRYGRGRVYKVSAVLRSGELLGLFRIYNDSLNRRRPSELDTLFAELKQALPDREIDLKGLNH